jgi:pimeloyl-ACP methyl ester carboxylesterase
MAEAAVLRRVLVWIALLALLAYAALCLLVFARQRDLVYFPALTRVDAAATDFQLRSGDAVLRGWQVNPGHRDALVYFGGNAERVEGWRGPFAQWFGGRTVYLVAYRGYGASEGTPDQQALLDDSLALHDEIRRRHPDGDIAVVGRSLGTGIAAWVASQRPVERLALVTPFDGLAEVGQAHYPWLPVRWLARERYPVAEYLADYRGQVLVLRAGRDTVVPARNTDRLLEALPAPARVVDFPEHDHVGLADDPRYGEALAEFMR